MSSSMAKHSGFDKDLKSNNDLIRLTLDYFSTSFKAKEKKKTLAWVNLPAPTEIFYALDIIPFSPEQLATSSSFGFGVENFEIAESHGISRDACSFDSHLIGSCLSNSSPQADMMVSTSGAGCDAQGKSFEVASNLTGIPVHHMTTPFKYEDAEVIDYYKDELSRLIDFLEKKTGRELDYERLKSIVKESNEATKYFRRSNELRKARPVPIGGIECILHYPPITNLLGDVKRTTNFYKSLCDEIEQRIKEGVGVVDEDAIRIMWLHYPPLHDLRLLKHIETLGGIVVFTEPALLFWGMAEGNDTIDALSKKYTSVFSNGDAYKRIDADLKIAKMLEVDAVINFLHFGCKNICSIATMTKDAFKENMGIPVLDVDGDVIDPRNYASGQVRTRVEAFIEMLK